VGLHAVVVELWWDELVPERDDSERWNSWDEIKRVQDTAYPFAPPIPLLSLEGTGLGQIANSQLKGTLPEEMGGDGGPGTNPEQLFAVGYAACYQSSLLGVARGRGLDASDSTITSRVGIALPDTVASGLRWPSTSTPLNSSVAKPKS
jgi:hypothetical protein